MLRALLLLLLVLLMSSCTTADPPAPLAGKRILIFSHTTGYRHASIETGVAALRQLVRSEGGEAVASEDPAIFASDRLAGFSAIVLLSSTTDPRRSESEWLVGERRAALQAFLRSGRGIVGIHAAADSHYHWPWYGEMLGGQFRRHPEGTPQGRLGVADAAHPSTAALPASIVHTDEYYFFQRFDPRSRLLLTLDPASIGASEAGPSPISWARTFAGGRVFYTALGHTAETYAQPFFLEHLRGGLRWAAGLSRRNSGADGP